MDKQNPNEAFTIASVFARDSQQASRGSGEQIAQDILGMNGAMVGYSKSGYREDHPDNTVVFNSNVCIKEKKIWYGDLDMTKSSHKLEELAQELGEEIFVLNEHDGRFGNEDKPLLDNAIAKFSPKD